MTLTGKVVKVISEERDLIGKDGIKKHLKATRVQLFTDDETVVGVSYDENFQAPTEGMLKWQSPPVRKYENYHGMVAEVVW